MKLKILRIQKGFIRQQDFAAAIGVKQSTLSMWENGHSKPEIETIKKLAEVLEVSVAEILECF